MLASATALGLCGIFSHRIVFELDDPQGMQRWLAFFRAAVVSLMNTSTRPNPMAKQLDVKAVSWLDRKGVVLNGEWGREYRCEWYEVM